MRPTRVAILALSTPLPLTLHPAAVYLGSLGIGSYSTMESALNAIARLLTNGECDAMTLDWAALRYQHTAAVRAALMKKHAPSTVNKMLCALRRVLKEALKLDLIEMNHYIKAVDLAPVHGTAGLSGRALSSSEIAALMRVCHEDTTLLGARDAALIALLRGAGLRRAEAVNLDFKDFKSGDSSIHIRNGKGGKDRTVYLPDFALAVLEDWLRIRGRAHGPLLCPIRKGGELQLRRLTPQAVLFILRKRAVDAGVSNFSPHDFRRTFCSDLLDSGVDIVTVQKLAGHSNPGVTSKYDRRGEETKRQAVQQLDVPYTPRK